MDTSASEIVDLKKEQFAALGIRRKWSSQSHKLFMIESLGFPDNGEFYAAMGEAVRDDLFQPMILRSRLEFIGVAIVTIAIALLTFIGIAWVAGGTLQLNLAIVLLIVILAIMIGFAQSPKPVNINAIVNATNAEKALAKKLMRFRKAAISGEVVVGGEKQVWTRSIAVNIKSEDFVSRVGLLLTLGENALGPLGWIHWPMPMPIVTKVTVASGSEFETELLIHWLAQNPQDIQQASAEEIELLRHVLGKEGLLEGWVKSNVDTLFQFRETLSSASSPTAAWTKMADDKKFGSYSHIRSITRGVNDKFNDQIKAAATKITH